MSVGRHRKPEGPPYRLGLLVTAGAGLGAVLVHRPHPVAEPIVPVSVTVPAAPVVFKTVTPAPKPSRADVAVTAALSKLGAPYVWGAKGPNRFDCSGLTQWAYRQAGIALPEDTFRQITVGTPVAEPEAGDLLFEHFTKAGPTHVLLAINNHEVVEAPGQGMNVRVSPMPANYVARRIT